MTSDDKKSVDEKARVHESSLSEVKKDELITDKSIEDPSSMNKKKSGDKETLAIYWLPIGIGIGTALGAAMDNIAMGISLGIIFGLIMSIVLKKGKK